MILVTGATGLIGSHLTCRLVQQGKTVVALKRTESSVKNLAAVAALYASAPEELLAKITWVNGDITDIFSVIDALEGVDEIYHCAGLVSFDPRDAARLMKINAEGTANMINAALECGIKKFCHVSSVATLPDHDNKKIIDESIYWKASPENSHYAISKYGAEREAWRGVEEGLNVVIVNPAVVLGAGCYGQSSSRLVDECYKGISIYTEGITGYVDVRDVVSSMISLMEKNKFGERYILSAENLAFKTVFDLFHREFNKPAAKYKAGKGLLRIGRMLDAAYSSLTHTERRLTKDIARAALDVTFFKNEKIKAVAGTTFIPVSESVKYIAADYLQSKKKN